LDLVSVYFITGYSQRPLHLMGTVGMISFMLGAIGMTYLTIAWCVSRLVDSLDVLHLHQTAIFYYCITALLFGSQWIIAGLLAELLAAIVRPNNKPYSIAETAGQSDGQHDG
jgi:dolichol-phosphate mannosyltransferase